MSEQLTDPAGAPPVGREIVFRATHELGRATIQRFAATIGDHNPLYWDEQYARNTAFGGITAPPTLIFEVNHNLRGELDEDGFLRQFADFLAPLGLPERAGNDYQVQQPARPDDVINLRRRIVDVTERQGKTGSMIFVASEIQYSNQRGEILGTDVETMVARRRTALDQAPQAAPGGPPARAAAAEATGEAIPPLTIPVTPVLTAMYCAATWDFTRLHYDTAFVQSEGFHERVVDPQMYGAFLARMLTDWISPAGSLRRLRLSYRAPAFVGDTLRFQGNVVRRSDQNGQQQSDCDLSVANQQGKILVRASAAVVRSQ